jgi:pyruvate/2-oxoglutarate dehydrogenase complex dihydrolipoamide acyltransferase (E2) component
MSRTNPGYRTIHYAEAQHQGADWSAVMVRTHAIHGMIDVDVTEARRRLHEERRRTGRPMSFTALLVASFAHSVGAEPAVQAFRKGRSRVVIFDDVDVSVLVEHVIDGERIPMPHVVRRANRKSPAQIDAEIRAARDEPAPYGRALRFAPLWLWVPAVFRRWAIARLLSNPQWRKRFTGTATVTAVSMFGKGTGWGIPFIAHSVCLTVGGIGKRPGIGPNGAIEPREFVCLTVSVDHDVVNGAPLARFISRFRDSIESASMIRPGPGLS